MLGSFQALYVFMALSLARDEFQWLLRHYDNPPPKKANVKWHHEEFVDRQIPELMFHMEELRGELQTNNPCVMMPLSCN